jgi:hypothetical protein
MVQGYVQEIEKRHRFEAAPRPSVPYPSTMQEELLPHHSMVHGQEIKKITEADLPGPFSIPSSMHRHRQQHEAVPTLSPVVSMRSTPTPWKSTTQSGQWSQGSRYFGPGSSGVPVQRMISDPGAGVHRREAVGKHELEEMYWEMKSRPLRRKPMK